MSPKKWIAKGTNVVEVREVEWPGLMINHEGLNTKLNFTKKKKSIYIKYIYKVSYIYDITLKNYVCFLCYLRYILVG